MSRRRKNGSHVDVFVVFSDISLSLAFILLVYAVFTGLAVSKAVIEANRTIRQQEVRDEIIGVWRADNKSVFEIGHLLSLSEFQNRQAEGRDQLDTDYKIESKSKLTVVYVYPMPDLNKAAFKMWEDDDSKKLYVIPLAKMQFNGSYLRVSVYDPQFDNEPITSQKKEDSETMKAGLAKEILTDVAKIAATRFAKDKDIDYVEIQGISDQPVGRQDDEMEVSRKRALNFEKDMVASNLINDPQRPIDPKLAMVLASIPLKFIECFGTGSLIYPDYNPNRVDIRLFFTDNGPDNNGIPTN